MSETENTIILAGRVVGFTPPTQGQIEAMIRIGRAVQRGTDDAPNDFWLKQIDRMGTLLESLIAPNDRDLVDELYLTGQIDHATLIRAIMAKVQADTEAAEGEAVKSEDKAIAKAKTASVKRK